MVNFRYFISKKNNEIDEYHDLWNGFIPEDRKNRTTSSESITYGTFFKGAETFLTKNIEKIPNINVDDHDNIFIFLDKHGKFYHPARIEISKKNDNICFVLNTAVNETGKMCMKYEIESLTELNKKNLNYVPNIYFHGDVVSEESELSMFCGNWFENYCEFHISPFEDSQKIIVWDPSENYYLSFDEEIEVYRQCSKIMTEYYDERSFSQISPWHHAAGDFILKKDNGIDVKLITVRQFAPFAEVDEPDENTVLYGLLYFMINLSIRMRLDRIDGVDKTVWADEHAMDGFFKGFFEALTLKKPVIEGNSSLKECFIEYIQNVSYEDLDGMGCDLVSSYNENSPEIPLIEMNLEKHIKNICTFLK